MRLSTKTNARRVRVVRVPGFSEVRDVTPPRRHTMASLARRVPAIAMTLRAMTSTSTTGVRRGATRVGDRRRAFARAFATGGEGNNITSALMEQMQQKIRDGLEAESVEVRDESGNGRHVSIKVIAKAFEGKSAVNRQRAVYKCIFMELQDAVHAVNEMVTLTPEEAA